MSKAYYKKQWEKSLKTRLEKYGAPVPAHVGQHRYSRTRGGRRADLGNQYYRSSWEANYARYLNWLVEQKSIKSWRYEPETFVFHGVTRGAISYTPDFEITENNGTVVYHEVKGWMDTKSKTRLRRMAKYYPEVKIVVIDEKQYNKIAGVVAGIIPGWEFKGPTAV